MKIDPDLPDEKNLSSFPMPNKLAENSNVQADKKSTGLI
jgi:hypothetical protein